MRTLGTWVALAAFVAPATASAQGTWAVVVADVGEPSAPARRGAEIAAVRLRSEGASVVDVPSAQAAVERRLGARPERLPEGFAGRLATAADEVLEHVAFGRTQEALDAAEPLLARAEAHLAAVGADETARTHVANLCLFTVRALLHEERGPEAEMRATDCVRYLPSLEPDPQLHPPDVRELFTRIRDGALEVPRGTLAVAGRTGCAVVVNGLALGEIPFERAVPAGAYQVQVVCDGARAARVQRVDVPRGGRADVDRTDDVSARVDARDGLALTYRTEDARASAIEGDAAAIGRIVDVRNVLVVSSAASALTLRRIGVDESGGRTLATAELPATPTSDRVGEAVVSLVVGGGGDGAGQPDAGGPPTAAGVALGGVGIAGLVTSWVLYATWLDLQSQVDALDPVMQSDAFERAVEDRDSRGTVVMIAGAASAAVLTAAVPMLLPRERGVPWWSWVAGALGVGAIAFGVVHAAGDGSDLDTSPGLDGMPRNVAIRTVPLGPIIAMHGAPLLAVPLTYLIRSATRADLAASASADGRAAHLSLSARF